MGWIALLKSKEGLGFVVSSFIGFVIGASLPIGWWTPYATIFFSYHIFLIWLVLIADHETGFSLPMVHTLVTHGCCLLLLFMIAFALSGAAFNAPAPPPPHPSGGDYASQLSTLMGDRLKGMFMVGGLIAFGPLVRMAIRLAVTALAVFEVKWLFSAGKVKVVADVVPVVTPDLQPATGFDQALWIEERSKKKRVYETAIPPKEDFERWLRARGKSQYVQNSTEVTPVPD